MEIKINEYTGVETLRTSGTITNIPDAVMHLDNDKNTPYRWAKVNVNLPNGKTEKVSAILYEGTQNQAGYDVGDDVPVDLQLEGEGAGVFAITLDIEERFDVSTIADSLAALRKESKTTAVADEA